MFKKTFLLLLSQILITNALAEDIYIYIDNFDASGETIIFDIMMDNTTPVYGAQFDLTSGDGVYNDLSSCICDVDGEVPDGCSECYWDFGPDHLKNTYEKDGAGTEYLTQTNSCYDLDEEEVSGACSNASYTTSGTCEELGECVQGGVTKTSFDYDCWVFGVPDDTNFSTCTVSSESDIGIDNNNDGLIDACQVANQSCDNVGVDSLGNLCDTSVDADCGDAGAIFQNWDKDLCEDTLGLCDTSLSGNECGCVYDGDSWAGTGYEWYPYDLWSPYSLPEVCQANSDLNGVAYDWLHSDTDPNGDNYFIDATLLSQSEWGNNEGNYQYCIVPGAQDGDEGMIPGNSESYEEYMGLGTNGASDYNCAGHCSDENGDPAEGFCVGNGDQGTTNGAILDWPQSCCSSTQGALWVEPYRDYERCTQSVVDNINIPNSNLSWTAYDNRATCESNKGIWVGSINAPEESGFYEEGENFVDTNGQLDVVDINGDHIPGVTSFQAAAQVGINSDLQSGGDRILIVGFVGDVLFPATRYCSDSNWNNQEECESNGFSWTDMGSQLVVSVEAEKTITQDAIATIVSKNVCERGNAGDCVYEFVFSDNVGTAIPAYFEPYIWDTNNSTGYGVSSGSDDNVCSRYAGENMLIDGTCASYCGDGYCDSTSEDFSTCKMDCESMLDDGFCNLYDGETFQNTSDCLEFGCGDNVCSGIETSLTCSSDCLSVCGNGTCDEGENAINCNQDCSTTCGDGNLTCDAGENFLNCDVDCDSECGDGVYHHAGIGGTEDGECEDYQLVCGDQVYHYLGLTINGLETDSDNAEDENCVDYEIACGDGVYHYLGLMINNITASATDAETDSCSDYPAGGVLGDNVCNCGDAEACGDYSTTIENPGNESACASECGDEFYHHVGIGGVEDDGCDDYTPTSNDGVCDGSSGIGESSPDGNGEYIGNESACPDICGDGFCSVDEDCDADCVGVDGDGVCARWTFQDTDGDGIYASLENCYTHAECTYDLTAFNVCGNGICEDGTSYIPEGEIDAVVSSGWGEMVGENNCNRDCAVSGDGACTVGEEITSNSWYSYADCFECGDNFLDNDECQDGYGESSDPNDPDFCFYDCWGTTGTAFCGDHECTGPENQYNCPADQVTYEFPDGPPYGEITINSTSTGDCLNIENEMPIAYSLSNNYPNPFNPSTTISYSVKNAGNVKIDIYNILGQHIYTLVNDYHVPSVIYQVSWNSVDQSKIPISSGVYIYKMVSGDFSEEGRMTIIK